MTDHRTPTDSRADPRRGLLSASFVGLLVTQLLTAVNDNVFRWLVIGIGKDYVDGDPFRVSLVLMGGTACFVLPYLLLAAPAGYLADRFRKRNVIVACKIAEIVIMATGVVAIVVGSLPMLFVAVGMMGAQSALFGPSKLGSVPEILRPERISMANGLFGLTTVAATVIGMGVGSWLSDATGEKGQEAWWISAVVLIGTALVGTLTSLVIRGFPAARPDRHFPWNAATQTWRDLQSLAANRAMLRVAFGVVFFWSVGALAQLNIDQFAAEGGAIQETDKIPLLMSLVAGVGVGSVLAGLWSGKHVELGILPLGAFGVAISSMALYLVQGEIISPNDLTAGFVFACVLLFCLGSSAGLFSVPLEAYMQHRSPPECRGSILAASNFLTFTGVLVSALLFAGMRSKIGDGPLLLSREIFLVIGIATLPVTAYIVLLIPQVSIRFLVWLATSTVYRVRVSGPENLPERGGALLAANHVSWMDAVLLLVTSSRPVRMIAYAGNFQGRVMRWLADLWGVILISGGPKSIAKALKTARQALQDGELVCIFPEGGITRSGQLQGFKPGLLKILKGTDAPVVPVYLDGLWGSIFSFRGGKFFWKWPRKWPYPISIHFGPPLHAPDDAQQVQRSVQQLGALAVEQRSERNTRLLPQLFIEMCKRRGRGAKVTDSTGNELSGTALLTRSLVLRRLLRRHVLADSEQIVGVLLPPASGAVVVNAALALDRRVSANLNYTVSSEVMNACIEHAGIKHVLTSRKFMEKMSFDLKAEVVYLEDFKDKVTIGDKIKSLLAAALMPAGMLERSLKLNELSSDDLLTIIFTSGSTGVPKGVMLTHGNIRSNVQAVDEVVQIRSDDVVIGVLPFFHSFGYTATLWLAIATDAKGAYHFSPLDAKQVGKLSRQNRGTVLLATPTFLRNYLRRCSKEDFMSLDTVVAGAEKLPPELSDAFEEKFGIRPVEGYGATELSPVVSLNVPASRSSNGDSVAKEGTVGRPLPGIAAKIVHLETGDELGINEPGMLMIKGPNVMKGYLGRDDLTAEVIKDGWYVTGDVAMIDEDGFIKITGRESRFSKIGGEMVPHIKVEETLAEIIGADEEEGLKAAVTAVPHPKKGEQLVVIHTALNKTPEELCQSLADAGLPNLFIPSRDSFHQVDELPVLGTGKLDLKGIKTVALEVFGPK